MDESLNHSLVVVSKTKRSGTFSSICEALSYQPNSLIPLIIYIEEGVYEERVNITRDDVHLIGAGIGKTVITHHTVAGQLDNAGEITSTLGSKTLMLDAHNCSLSSLTVKNDFDFIENALKPAHSESREKHTQAVALLLGERCDKCSIYDVSIEGFQDTLFVKGGRSYFHQCSIYGSIDFIFGDGNAIFDQCQIIARNAPLVEGSMGYLTAPSTPLSQEFGLTFFDCKLLKEDSLVPINSYALGRPWHPTTTFADGRYADPNAIGCSTFIHCFIDDHIYGWDKMSGKDINGERIWFTPETDARFSEYQCYGPGSNDTQSLQNTNVVARFTLSNIFTDWTPKNGFHTDLTNTVKDLKKALHRTG